MTADLPSARVSIVIPSFNQGRFLGAAIESVFDQNYPGVELIVIDSGSTDDTVSILKKYENRLRWVSRTGIGLADSINTGLQMASGGIISCLDAGSRYLPHAIRHAVDAFARHPDTDLVYGDFHVLDEAERRISRVRTIPFDRDILLYDGNFICRSALFCRRRLFDEIGYFDNNLRYLMDYEFLLRAAKRRLGFRMIEEYLAAIRQHTWHEIPQNRVHSRLDELQKVRMMYARAKVRRRSAMKLLGLIYRVKRRLHLIRRGHLEFMNPYLAHWMGRTA